MNPNWPLQFWLKKNFGFLPDFKISNFRIWCFAWSMHKTTSFDHWKKSEGNLPQIQWSFNWKKSGAKIEKILGFIGHLPLKKSGANLPRISWTFTIEKIRSKFTSDFMNIYHWKNPEQIYLGFHEHLPLKKSGANLPRIWWTFTIGKNPKQIYHGAWTRLIS